jgi:hypothetical protein
LAEKHFVKKKEKKVFAATISAKKKKHSTFLYVTCNVRCSRTAGYIAASAEKGHGMTSPA